MKSVLRFASAAVLVLGAAACSDSSSEPGENVPRVELIAATNAPTPPAGNVARCYTNSEGTTESATCPVVRWGNVVYWIFAYDDARTNLRLVSYDEDDTIIDEVDIPGIRQLWQITVNDNAELVTVFGVNTQTANIPWSVLAESQPD
jgi:hypothetical protein